MPGYRGVAQLGQSVRFGAGKPQVRILSPRQCEYPVRKVATLTEALTSRVFHGYMSDLDDRRMMLGNMRL